MPRQVLRRAAFEAWQDGVSKAAGNRKWDAYDRDIRMIVGEFNRHLGHTPGFPSLDWKLIKAMIWTETGAASAEWKTRPIQIGVPGDPGVSSLLSGKEGAELILPPDWRAGLTPGIVRTMPVHNIRAGVGYLLMRMAIYENRSVAANGSAVQEVAIKHGDSLDRIAKARGSTVEILKKLNPGAAILKPGGILKYQEGSVERVIIGWRPFTTAMVAQRYNGGGDPDYAKKLDFALGIVRKRRETICQ